MQDIFWYRWHTSDTKCHCTWCSDMHEVANRPRTRERSETLSWPRECSVVVISWWEWHHEWLLRFDGLLFWGRWIGALSDCTKPCWVFNASWFCYWNFPSLYFESIRVLSLSISPASFWRMRPHDSWLRRRTFCSSGGKEAIITGVTKFIIELKTE